MKPRIGQVRLSGEPVGMIEALGDRTRFTYLPSWLARADATPVSLTLPLRAEPYESEGLHPFFDNLLPEGWYRELASRVLKVSQDDAVGLLLGTCGDCVGAVEVVPWNASLDETTGDTEQRPENPPSGSFKR